jgi:hypothetical protein
MSDAERDALDLEAAGGLTKLFGELWDICVGELYEGYDSSSPLAAALVRCGLVVRGAEAEELQLTSAGELALAVARKLAKSASEPS